MMTTRRLRLAAAMAVGALLVMGGVTACNHPDPSISIQGIDFVSSIGAHFPSTRQGASYVLPSGLPGQLGVRFTSEVRYPSCTLDFDGRARLGVKQLADATSTQMVMKATSALTAATKVSGTLTCVQDTAGSIPESSSFTATIVPTPMVTATPATLTFGPIPVGSRSQPAKVAVKNTGSAPAKIVALLFSRDDWALDTNSCTDKTLAVGAFCSFRIAFTPTKSYDVITESLIIALGNGALIAPDPVALQGYVDRGEGKFTPSSNPLDFVNVVAGTSATKTLTITNSGSGSLYIKYLTLATDIDLKVTPDAEKLTVTTSTSFYSIHDDTCGGTTLAPGATCQTQVTFTPTIATTRPVEVWLFYICDRSPSLIPKISLMPERVRLTGWGVEPPRPADPQQPDQPQPPG